MIDSHGLSDRIAELERLLTQAPEQEERVRNLVELAWYLRLRDTRRALELADEADRLLAEAPAPDPAPLLVAATRESMSARLILVRGEAARLFARLDEAREMIAEASRRFIDTGDLVGEGDALMCEADRLLFAGDTRQAIDLLGEARFIFLDVGDAIRARLAETASINLQLPSDIQSARHRWDRISLLEMPDHPAVRALSAFVEASLHRSQSSFLAAITTAKAGVPHAEAAGLVWLNISLRTLIGGAFANISDYPSAMEWKQGAYDLAQPTGWPEARGATLASLAHTQGRIGRKQEARALYQEALAELQKLDGTRRFGITCITYGNTCYELGETDEALSWFTRARDLGTERDLQDVSTSALLGIARCCNALDRPEDAADHLTRALKMARSRGDRIEQVVILHALAATRRRLLGEGPEGRRATIALLEEAVAVGKTIPGYIMRSDLLSELAAEHEALGEHKKALAYERLSRASWEQAFNKENAERLIATQARLENQRAREEAIHMKALAAAELERAQTLDQANRTLELLGLVGKEITASLDIDAVFATLHHRLGVLLQVRAMFIGLLDETGQRINMIFRMEDGRSLPPYTIPVSDPVSHSARAVRENRELLMEKAPGAEDPAHIPGTREMMSVIFCPLTVGERVLGVLSVQHDEQGAFGPREMQIVRSVAAYGAIALANAQAYRSLDEALASLQDAQGRLVQQEKLASLGQLVAGVAHEVNTPVGILLSLASHLVGEVSGIGARLKDGQLRRSDLMEHLSATEETAALMLANAKRAANLVSAFKQVAADRTNDEAREVELAEYLREVAATVQPLLRPRAITLTVTCDGDLPLTTYPGLLAQVVTNLVQNSVTHAFDGIAAPALSLAIRRRTASGDGGRDLVELEFADNGVGMPAEVRAKAFEPFFTTRRSSGGTGLGLHVVHNIVTGPLQGTVDLWSAPGKGTRFTLRLPVRLDPARIGDFAADHALAMALGTD